MSHRRTSLRTLALRTSSARRTTLAAAGLLGLAACQDPAAPRAAGGPALDPIDAPSAQRGADAAAQPIPGEFIVVFRDGVDDPAGKAKEKERRLKAGKKLKHVYTSALKGFAAALDADELAELRRDPDVAYVEADQRVELSQTTQGSAPWGLDRIDQRTRPLSGTYGYTRTGAGVRVYVIDTGINTGHTDFGGRASNVYNGVGGSSEDCNGHGTHVAGTVGGARFGVAKGALLRGVKVFTCSGGSANSTIIAGIDWVRANHIKPAVANLSLGGGLSSATNTAVRNLAAAGVYTVVAAGNSNANACNYSPASEPSVMTVASSTSGDGKSSFSNWGSCVDVYAPGSSILSAWIGSTTATNTISGTSMAAPHVAGVGALYKHTFGDAGQATIDGWVVNNATASVITSNVSGTPNRLLFKATL